jgi:hypothetical protein
LHIPDVENLSAFYDPPHHAFSHVKMGGGPPGCPQLATRGSKVEVFAGLVEDPEPGRCHIQQLYRGLNHKIEDLLQV